MQIILFLLTLLSLNDTHRMVIYPPTDTLYFQTHPVGGIILFAEHFNNIDSLTDYIAAAKRNNPYPMKVFVDMEGGLVNRLKKVKGFENLPSAYEMANEYCADTIYIIWSKVAKYMKQIGIDVNLAPVMDKGLGLTGAQQRTFGTNPMKHIKNIKAFTKAMKDNGIKTVMKHFPGYGKLTVNTDLKPGTLAITVDEITDYMEPFVIMAPFTDGIMLSSIIYTSLDSLPAGLSPKIVKIAKDITSGFTITDDIGGKGMEILYGNSEKALEKALKTDIDYIIYIKRPQ